MNASDGFPKGVSNSISSTSSSSGMLYKPLPPIMPIFTVSILFGGILLALDCHGFNEVLKLSLLLLRQQLFQRLDRYFRFRFLNVLVRPQRTFYTSQIYLILVFRCIRMFNHKLRVAETQLSSKSAFIIASNFRIIAQHPGTDRHGDVRYLNKPRQ